MLFAPTLFVLAAVGAQAGPETPSVRPPPLAAIQKRKFELAHELSLHAGGLPSDPFYKGLTATVGYTWHATHWLAWEVAQVTYSYNLDTNLKKEVRRFRAVADDEFPEIEWIAASHLVLKPFYGKQALFNTDVLHLEGYLQAGPVAVKRSDLPEMPAFGVDAGVGVRLWLGHNASIRADLGELVYLLSAGPALALHARLGLAFNFGADE